MGEDGERDPICNVTKFEAPDDTDASCQLTVRVRSTWFHISTSYTTLSKASKGSKGSQANTIADDYKELHDAYNGKLSKAEANGDAVKRQTNGDVMKKQTSGNTAKEQQNGDAANKQPNGDTVKEQQNGDAAEEKDNQQEVEIELQNWLIAPFGEIFADKAPQTSQNQTLFDWYEAHLYVYNLQVSKSGELQPVEETNDANVHTVKLSLCPHFVLPKYLRKLTGVAWYSPQDLIVLDESAEPAPYHPSRVKYAARDKNKETQKAAEAEFFLKMHMPQQDHSTKREIRLLHEVQKQSLDKRGVRIARLRGFVAHVRNPSSQAQILGFLMDSIDSPTPLTHMMDTNVDAGKREKWAKESEKMVEELHKNGVVWGDAKGDNFVVDENDTLWMIDFGGGYTEGWVEHELMETEQGDDAGTERLVNGLRDPENCTDDDGLPSTKNEKSNLFVTKEPTAKRDKRKAGADEDGASQERKRKAQKR